MSTVSKTSAFKFIGACALAGAIIVTTAMTVWSIITYQKGISLGLTAIAAVETIRIAGGADQAVEATQDFIAVLERARLVEAGRGCEAFMGSAIVLVGDDVAIAMADVTMSDEFDRKSGQFVAVIRAALRNCPQFH